MSRVMFDASANHVIWQRAQRTVRPAGPREAGSLMYVVEQLGQAISMGSMVFWESKPTSRPLMDWKPWQPPSHWMNWWNPAPRLWRRCDNLVKSAVPEGCAGRGSFPCAPEDHDRAVIRWSLTGICRRGVGGPIRKCGFALRAGTRGPARPHVPHRPTFFSVPHRSFRRR